MQAANSASPRRPCSASRPDRNPRGPSLSRAMAGLPQRLARDGYLYLRGLLPEEAILAARQAILGRLEAVDEVAAPATAGIATGRSRRRELHADLGKFWRSVSEEPALRRLTGG